MIRQMYCTLAELEADLHLNGSEGEAFVLEKIQEASDYLQKEIGWFLPVIQTRRLSGRYKFPTDTRALEYFTDQKFFTDALLSINTISSDGTTLTADTDYLLMPDERHWANGPYSYLSIPISGGKIQRWSISPAGVVINGVWGKYNDVKALSASLASKQELGDATISASNGAQLSPGMDLVVEDEQEYVEATGDATAAVTTLAKDLDATGEILTLADGTKVNKGEIIRVTFEQMRIADINGNLCQVQRGWNRTSRVEHNAGDAIDVYRTFNVTRGINGTTAVEHDMPGEGSLTINRQMVPSDINGLCKIIAGNWLKFAQSGYQGKVGDQVTGQIMYQAAIPTTDLDRIRALYDIGRAL
jgi:hypothetical protein